MTSITADDGTRRGRSIAIAAAVIGAPYIALNAYWAVGGEGLQTEYGSHLVGQAGTASFQVFSLVLVAVFSVAAASGVLATSVGMDSPFRAPLLWLAWLSAAWLSIYGLFVCLIGWAVQAGIRDLSADENPARYRWHAFLFDPWLLVWGLVLIAALTVSMRAYLATGRKFTTI